VLYSAANFLGNVNLMTDMPVFSAERVVSGLCAHASSVACRALVEPLTHSLTYAHHYHGSTRTASASCQLHACVQLVAEDCALLCY
jgi:hypothetical protein